MRQIFTSLLAAVAILSTSSTFAEPGINATISNMHLWRGDEVADGLVLTTDLHITDAKNRLKVGFWGGANAIGAYKEFNYYINYRIGSFTLNMCDTYNFSEYATYNNEEFFNYHANETGRFLDASISYYVGDKFPLTLQWATILFGRDRDTTNSANRYSTFCSASYRLYSRGPWSIDAELGFAFALNNMDASANFFGEKSGLVETTIKTTYMLRIKEYTIPVFVTAMWNVQREKGYLQLSAQVVTF